MSKKRNKYSAKYLKLSAKRRGCKVLESFCKQDIIDRDGLNCYWCSKLLSYKQATLDHVIPISFQGHHTKSNVVIACGKCNQDRNKRQVEFLKREFERWKETVIIPKVHAEYEWVNSE